MSSKWERETRQDEVLQDEMSQDDVRQDEVRQDEVLQDEVLQDEVLQDEVLQGTTDASLGQEKSDRRGLAFFDSTQFDWHEGTSSHPERPERLMAIRNEIASRGLEQLLLHPHFDSVDPDVLRAVHSEKYLSELERLAMFDGGHLTADTYVTGQSYDVALLAAGAVQAAVRGVVGGTFRRAFCAVRPSGHHATRDRGMGFCLLNNVVIGAFTALGSESVSRVAIFDWDVHHGNGTEALTYARGDIYFASTHQYPAFPFTGEASARGCAEGKGCNLNVPLAPGAGDAEVLQAWDEQILPEWQKFLPDLVLISAGFDADARDPLADLTMTPAGYRALTARVVEFADEHCQGRIVSVLEGGYDLEALAEDTCAHLEELL